MFFKANPLIMSEFCDILRQYVKACYELQNLEQI